MGTIEFQKRKIAFETCVDDTLSVFLARQSNDPEYLDDDTLAETHERAWELLDEEQKEQIWGLSSDLYALSDNEKRSDAIDQPSEQSLTEMISNSYEKQDWKKLLRCFRFQLGLIDKETVEYMRGRAWEELGFPRVSVAFYDNASRIEPAKPIYRYLSMKQVQKLGDWEELQQRCERNAIEMPDDATMQLLVGELYHDIAMHKPDAAMNVVALEHLDRGFELLPHQTVRESVLGSAVASRVFVLTNLQRISDTIPFLNSWIEKLPNNAELRSTRGIVYLTIDYAQAVLDFEVAVEFGTALALPYLEVAKSKLLKRQYDETKRLCRMGTQLSHRDAELAEFHHLSGLAAFFMQDLQRAGHEFQRAATLAPFNQMIRTNERMLREGRQHFSLPKEGLRSEGEIAQLMNTH